jgi:hypothetical protein
VGRDHIALASQVAELVTAAVADLAWEEFAEDYEL